MMINTPNTYTSVTGEVYELADDATHQAFEQRAMNLKPGELIWAHRQDLNWKQQEAAQRLGITVQMLSQWERGTRLPTPAKAREIAEKLDMNVPQFVRRVVLAWLERDGVTDLVDVTERSPLAS